MGDMTSTNNMTVIRHNASPVPTPQALHPGAQGRRVSRRTLGTVRQQGSLRRGRYTPEPRRSDVPAGHWGQL
jgi:hypothetical protein